MLLKQGTGNEERETGNGEWENENGKLLLLFVF